jgi:hypothetical protein
VVFPIGVDFNFATSSLGSAFRLGAVLCGRGGNFGAATLGLRRLTEMGGSDFDIKCALGISKTAKTWSARETAKKQTNGFLDNSCEYLASLSTTVIAKETATPLESRKTEV